MRDLYIEGLSIHQHLEPTPEATDRILQVLVRKTKRIREELGSLSEVLEGRLASTLFKSGIAHDRVDEIARQSAPKIASGRYLTVW